MSTLTFRAVDVENGLSDLQRKQASWAIDLYGEDEVIETTAFYTIHDESGVHIYDVHLFCDDDGMVHKAGTLDRVASFSQGGATGTEDEALMESLDNALEAFGAAPTKASAKKPARASAKKPAKAATKKPAKASAKKPAKASARRPAKAATKKRAKSPAQKPANASKKQR